MPAECSLFRLYSETSQNCWLYYSDTSHAAAVKNMKKK